MTSEELDRLAREHCGDISAPAVDREEAAFKAGAQVYKEKYEDAADLAFKLSMKHLDVTTKYLNAKENLDEALRALLDSKECLEEACDICDDREARKEIDSFTSQPWHASLRQAQKEIEKITGSKG